MVDSLRRWRENRRITQAQLGRLIKVGQQSVSRYERRQAVPLPQVMRRILRVTAQRVQPNHFYGLAGARRP